MAKTGAERQTAYRKGRPMAGENGERRINTWVSTGAALGLSRLAHDRQMAAGDTTVGFIPCWND